MADCQSAMCRTRRGLMMCTYGREGGGWGNWRRQECPFPGSQGLQEARLVARARVRPTNVPWLSKGASRVTENVAIRAMRQHGINSIVNKGSRSSLKRTQLLPDFPIFRPRATIDYSSIYLLPHWPVSQHFPWLVMLPQRVMGHWLAELAHEQPAWLPEGPGILENLHFILIS